MNVLRVFRVLTSVLATLGLCLTALIAGPVASGLPAPAQPAAKTMAKGRIKVVLKGTGSYTVKGKRYRKTASASKTCRVRPGRYRITAPGASVKPAKVKVRAGTTAKVRVAFPAPQPEPAPAPRPTPTPTPQPKINPYTIAAGWVSSCGLDRAGKAWCWGMDSFGLVGDGNDDQAREYAPVAVAGDHTFTALVAGWDQACGLDTQGRAWCWGKDISGQIGDGDDGQADEYAPVAVSGGHTFTALTSGADHVCGLDPTGAAWCWGADSYGQAGDGDASQSSKFAPVAVAGGHTFTSISAGSMHTCAIDTAGAAWCWGWDEYGQLGRRL